MEIGKRIAELRKERKWTQLELAEKLFVTDKAVSKWEQGLGCPEPSTIVEISRCLYFVLKRRTKKRTTKDLWCHL